MELGPAAWPFAGVGWVGGMRVGLAWCGLLAACLLGESDSTSWLLQGQFLILGLREDSKKRRGARGQDSTLAGESGAHWDPSVCSEKEASGKIITKQDEPKKLALTSCLARMIKISAGLYE